MKITYTGTHAPLNLDTVGYNGIFSNDMGLIILLNDSALITAVSPLVYEIARNCDWRWPDLDNTKVSLFIDLCDEEFNVSLLIEAQPPQ